MFSSSCRLGADCAGGGFGLSSTMEAGVLPALDEDQADMLTPSELLLY